MNGDIKQAIKEGRLVLLLGAGASGSSTTRLNEPIPLGYQLAEILAEKSGLEYSNEPLNKVYSASKKILGNELNNIFDSYFNHCKPSVDYNTLAKYVFRRIYTLNIDDACENAFLRNSKQHLYIRGRNDNVSQPDQLFYNIDYIKLNGDIKRPDDGYIFSEQEYGQSSAREPLWYKELGVDFYNYKFLFIGTKLSEPLFYHQIERYKGATSSKEQRSYVLTPSATPIEKITLEEYNIEHISGKLSDFTQWLINEFPKPPTPSDTLINSRPEYNVSAQDDKSHYLEIFRDVLPISRANIQILNERDSGSPIRHFYRGFKPTWKDILDRVPAELKNTKKIYAELLELSKKKDGVNLYCIFGSAGSGKTTLLKQLALKFSEINIPCYFIESINANISSLIVELEKKNKGRYFIFLDRIADSAQIIGEVIYENRINKGVIIGAESKSIWKHRGQEYFSQESYMKTDISLIDKNDAVHILNKVERFGFWTQLGRLNHKQRLDELINKSRKQLLIGLMETTMGEGYNQIIKNDFDKIPSNSHKALLVLIGIATYQRVDAHESTLTRALIELNLNANIVQLASEMDGIIYYKNGFIEARHYNYIDRLFNNFLDTQYIYSVLSAYISAFTVYSTPIVTNVIKTEAAIYKSLVNSKNIRKLLRNDEELVLSLYNKYEKKLEHEGLFLLQYGIALRDFGHYDDAYEKIKIANIAYPNSPQIEHAYAQMKMIIALRCNNEKLAYDLLDEAEEIFLRLDGGRIKIIDGYPLVSLSKGHIQIAEKYRGKAEARKIAGEYYERIRKIYFTNKVSQDSKIESTSSMLFKYSTTGLMDSEMEDVDLNF